MLNSLDSIEHVVAALQQKHKGSKITITPFFTNNFNDMPIIMSNLTADGIEGFDQTTMFFGVFTIGDVEAHLTTEQAAGLELVLDNDNATLENVVTLSPNSQIIELCHGLSVQRLTYNSGTIPDLKGVGQFRGFEITIR